MDLLKLGQEVARRTASSRTITTGSPGLIRQHITSNASQSRRVQLIHSITTRQFSQARRYRDDAATAQIGASQPDRSANSFNPSASVADEMLSTLGTSAQRQSRAPPSSASSLLQANPEPRPSTTSGSGRPERSSKRIMDMGDEFWDMFSVPQNKKTNQPPPIAPEKNLPMKLGPAIGRTVHIENERGMDVGRAFRQLDVLCSRNKVKRDFHRQKFHERPGMKRKRLKSERWRVRFKEGFKALVQKAVIMKKQGW